MITPELIDFVRKQLAAGSTKESLVSMLATQGWNAKDVEEALAAAAPATTPAPAAVPAAAQPAPTPATMPPSVTPPIQPTQPVAVQPTAYTPAATIRPMQPRASRMPGKMVIIAGSLIVLLLGGAAFAYVAQLGPFAPAALYTEDNFFSGLISKISTISSSSYGLSGSFAVVSRESGAVPFTLTDPNAAAHAQQYKNDAQRADDINTLLRVLLTTHLTAKTYPASLSSIKTSYPTVSYTNTASSVTDFSKDPVTGAKYAYQATQGGSNFTLTVTFETADAISAVKKAYGFTATSTPISGKTVTFTKDSSPYFYLSAQPPKPFLQQLGEMTQMLPPDSTASMSVAASSNWKNANADWKINLDATADLSDFSFKIDADALKKDSIYYVRINNIPGVFGAALTALKGQWIKIDPAASSTWPKEYTSYLSLAQTLPSSESQYKDDRQQTSDFLKQLVAVADESHLVSFADAPRSEKVDGRSLTRYDLNIRKEGILPFYQKMNTLAQSYPKVSAASMFSDQGTLDFLQSAEFDQTFDYYQKNTKLVLWVDSQGYPAKVEYTLRVVPPDTAVALKDKQINITFTLNLSDINTSVTIDAPGSAKPIGDLMQEEVQAQKASMQIH